MEIIKATQRLAWRFTEAVKRKSFVVNQNDIDALNIVGEYVERTQKEQYVNNELFAKLYVYLFMKVLENDKTTVFDNNARRKIGNLLKKPLIQIIEELKNSLNESEQYGFSKELGVKHPSLRTPEETIEENKKLAQAVKNPDNLKRLAGEVWDLETVKTAIEADVNFMINGGHI